MEYIWHCEIVFKNNFQKKTFLTQTLLLKLYADKKTKKGFSFVYVICLCSRTSLARWAYGQNTQL